MPIIAYGFKNHSTYIDYGYTDIVGQLTYVNIASWNVCIDMTKFENHKYGQLLMIRSRCNRDKVTSVEFLYTTVLFHI